MRNDGTMCPVCCLQPSDDVALLGNTRLPSALPSPSSLHPLLFIFPLLLTPILHLLLLYILPEDVGVLSGNSYITTNVKFKM